MKRALVVFLSVLSFSASVSAAGVWSNLFAIEQVRLNPGGFNLEPAGTEANSCRSGVFRARVGVGGHTASSIENMVSAVSRAEQLAATVYYGGGSVYTEYYRVKYDNSNDLCFIMALEVGPIYSQ
jgi:hypothetical protein